MDKRYDIFEDQIFPMYATDRYREPPRRVKNASTQTGDGVCDHVKQLQKPWRLVMDASKRASSASPDRLLRAKLKDKMKEKVIR